MQLLCSTTSTVTTSLFVQTLGHRLKTVHFTLSALLLAVSLTGDVSAAIRSTCHITRVFTCMLLP